MNKTTIREIRKSVLARLNSGREIEPVLVLLILLKALLEEDED